MVHFTNCRFRFAIRFSFSVSSQNGQIEKLGELDLKKKCIINYALKL